jgi:hypothetical protein
MPSGPRRLIDRYGELTMAVGALATLDDPGNVWLIQPPAGAHQSLPICPLGVWKNTFINEGEFTMAVGPPATLDEPGKV